MDFRNYSAPPPIEARQRAKRTKDDLHEWSIYRQNLTSTIAGSLLGIGDPQPLPFGDFQMHDQSVESVLRQGKKEDFLLGDKGQIYLRFGLPRVNVSSDQHSPPNPLFTRIGTPWSPQRNNPFGGGGSCHRKAASELDLRKAVLEAPTSRGPYMGHVPSTSHQNGFSNIDTGGVGGLIPPLRHQAADKRRFLSMNELDLDFPDGPETGPYALSAIADRNRTNHVTSGFGGATHGGGAPPKLRGPNAAGLGSMIIPRESFLQGKRHHSHYFSNLELFNTSGGYNYLRYAKAADIPEQEPKSSRPPHLVLRNLSFDADVRNAFEVALLRAPKFERILENISFDLHGGETMALLHTSEAETKALLNLLSNQHAQRGRTFGHCLLNGVPLAPRQLGHRVAYVCDHDLYPHLTVAEHLRLYAKLIRPATKAFSTESMISQLIQTLALAPFRNRPISDLGATENKRVKVACQILLDTDILVLDNIVKDMDLYDAAFLIDYLRDWASKLNRIVLMAIHPPTFELLSMFYKTTLFASGRIIYFGKTSKMTEYFERVNYPCPLFKNPCDYFVDLVTHDYLTVEASLESAERIRRLADSWVHHSAVPPEIPPCGALPPKVNRSNQICATVWLYYRFLLLFRRQQCQYLQQLFLNALLSLILGVTFLSLGDMAASTNDRFGLFYALLTLFLLPDLFLNMERVFKERLLLYNDSMHGLYPKFLYFTAKVFFDLPVAIMSYSCLVLPLYFLAGLQRVTNPGGVEVFGTYWGLTVLYCWAWRTVSWTVMCAFNSRFMAASCLGVLMLLSSLCAGVTLHPRDFWVFFYWLRYASPTQWTVQLLSRLEFLGNMTLADNDDYDLSLVPRPFSWTSELQFGCDKRTLSYGSIVTSLPCALRNGEDALHYANLSIMQGTIVHGAKMALYVGSAVIGGFGLLFLVLSCCCIYCNHRPLTKIRRRTS